MTSKTSSNIELKLKVLGIYQIVGGVLGLTLTISLFFKLSLTNFLLTLILILALCLYLFSIYCGTLLVFNKKSLGLNLSLINQYVQLVSFSIKGLAFLYVSGIFFSAGIDITNSFNLLLNLGLSSWQLNINSESEALIINFNLVALFLIVVIGKLKKKIKEEKIAKEIDSIGSID
ncbi:MAG TPA: hypothetical protein PKC72_08315 [Chitinophagaceae bacterium]|nr:hypothetical protein [Chitinophagaceae bacterium]